MLLECKHICIHYTIIGKAMNPSVAERTSYFCLACKLIWPLWSMHIFTESGWLILFSTDHFSRQHQIGESPPHTLFLRSFQTGQTYLLYALFISSSFMTSWGKPSNLWTSWVCLTQEQLYVLSKFGYVNCNAKFRSDIQLLHPSATFSGDIHASLLKRPGPHINWWLHHSCP